MNTLLGLLIIAVGSFCQSSSYVPIKKVKEWSWESFWLVQGIFAWLVFPLLGALLAVPAGSSLGEVLSTDPSAAFKAAGYGVLWGVGGLTFGLSMRYLGVALGQSIALGTCAGFGTLFPAIFAGENLFAGKGLVLLLGVSITLAGIAVIGYAGSLRAQNMTDEEKRAAVKDFALTKGLAVALLAGVMSACFNLGLEAGRPLQVEGGSALFRTLPATLMVTLGGFVTNAAYCLWQNARNRTFGGRSMPTTCCSARWPGRCGTRSSSASASGRPSSSPGRSWRHSPGASSWRSTSPSRTCGALSSGSGAGRRERPWAYWSAAWRS